MMRSLPVAVIAAAYLTQLSKSAPAASAPYKYVLAFSVDGMHSSDVEKYLAARPNSNMSKLLATGYEYSNAWTTAVRDSCIGSQQY
jgi:hypothetical protein